VALAVGLALLAWVTLAWAFAEEPLPFRDPYTGQSGEEWEEIITDSITLQVWNQLVDSEQIGPGEAVSYTNCTGGAFYPTPSPADPQVCGRPYVQVAWPRWDDMKDPSSCVTSRFGPYSPFFHFPHDNDRDLGGLHDWAWGITNTLTAYEAYAWGGATVMQADCLYTRTAVITIGIQAGSLEAFATYLHSLADYYSHQECIAHMDNIGMPWATHTLTGHPSCDYNPSNPQPDDVHGREFYTYTDSLRTDAAIQHVYRELVARSLQREGEYFPISLDTPILRLRSGQVSGLQKLSDLLYTFVHEWDFEHAAERRAQADLIASAVLAQRVPIRRIYLPVVVK
jgi:hypothetical protein